MKKIEVYKASMVELDYLVAVCEGYSLKDNGEILKCYRDGIFSYDWNPRYKEDESTWSPTSHWSQAGPIIGREYIGLSCWYDHKSGVFTCWRAEMVGGQNASFDTSPLIAAMRCYVASELGDEVEVPEELV